MTDQPSATVAPALISALLAFGPLFGFAGVLLVSAAMLVGLRHVRAAYVASPRYREG
jgi:hypothetical protein